MTQKQSKQNTNTFGDWAAIAIAKHVDKIIKHETEVLKDKDPEELHQMRVGMRRLRSAIVGFSPALKLPKAAREENVGKVARILGKLRDLDVMKEALETQYKPSLPSSEKKKLDWVLKTLKRQRKQDFYNVKITLKGKFYKHLKQGFQDWLNKPQYKMVSKILIYEVLPDLLLPQISKLLLHPGWLVGVQIQGEKIEFTDGLKPKKVEKLLDFQELILHDLRKEAKRTRYQMELFTQFYSDSYKNYVQRIKQIQDVLGEIQDCFVLAEFLAGIFESDLHKHMPKLVDQFTEIRYQKWQEWEVLQRQFLDFNTRQDLRQTIQHPEF